MLASINNSVLVPARPAAPSEAKPVPVREAPAKTDDEAQLVAFVSNITRADAAQVIALTQREPTQQSHQSVASAYAEF
jgi:hypothetical protein